MTTGLLFIPVGSKLVSMEASAHRVTTSAVSAAKRVRMDIEMLIF